MLCAPLPMGENGEYRELKEDEIAVKKAMRTMMTEARRRLTFKQMHELRKVKSAKKITLWNHLNGEQDDKMENYIGRIIFIISFGA